ncbi:purine nucleoside phosphorylase [Folsomia candida]|uniref:purine nucleoside phosphorylase n=1 Tax=Folsomia candida TaxID=158441 RepID=UPI000B8F7309|nr:purine nucleoside phosphorylase [Folsomia candida]
MSTTTHDNGNNSQGESCCKKFKICEAGYEGVGQYGAEALGESRDYLLSLTSLRPKVAIICGSGLGSLGEKVDASEGVRVPYGDIPHFPKSTAPGHKGVMTIGKLANIPVICMQGRFHLYEGYSAWTVSMPTRVFKLMGVKVLIVTNAAGGLNYDFRMGDIMIIKDHVNFPGFAGVSPLRGPNDPAFGERFTALNDAYDSKFRTVAKQIGEDMKMGRVMKEGVYGMIGGPAYETPAELRMFKMMGIDAIGMSTVQEIIAARHCGIRCLAFSIISNIAVLGYDTTDKPNEEEVIVTAKDAEVYLHDFILRFLTQIESELTSDYI